MVLENIPRIAAPTPDVMLREWINPRRPVILTNLFDAAPIREFDTAGKARGALGHVGVEVQPNYLTFLQTGERGERRVQSLASYLDLVEKDPQTRDLCVEFPTPEPLRAVLPPPAYATRLNDPADTVSATFLANAGNYNHLHFDDDQRGVFMYEVFGTKRFSLISPKEWRKLSSFLVFDGAMRRALAQVPARDANGRIFFQDLQDEGAREALLTYLGASDCLLHPGETLFMPALIWHYVEYQDTSLSITYRIGRNRYNRALAELFPQPTLFVQTLGDLLVDETRFFAEHPALGEELDAVLDAAYPDTAARVNAVHSFLMCAFETVTGESAHAVLAAREIYRLSLAV